MSMKALKLAKFFILMGFDYADKQYGKLNHEASKRERIEDGKQGRGLKSLMWSHRYNLPCYPENPILDTAQLNTLFSDNIYSTTHH